LKLRKSFLVSAATAVLAAASLAPALAQNTITFAQFQLGNGAPANPFVFTNAGAASGISVVSGSVPVNFTYQVANGYGAAPGSPIAATMTFTAMVSGTATSQLILGKLNLFQGLQLTNMVFTANVPVGGQTNLLTVSNSTGTLSGINHGSTAGFAGDSSTGDVVNFSSSFLSFAHAASENYALSFTSVNPSLAIAGNGYLRSFTTSGTGTFAQVSTPEASSLLLLMAGCVPAALIHIRRRNKK